MYASYVRSSLVPKQDFNAEWTSFARHNKSCMRWDEMRWRWRWDEMRYKVHSFGYQSRRWVLWGGIRAAGYPRVQSCTLEGCVFTHAQKGQQKLQHFYRGTESFQCFMRGFPWFSSEHTSVEALLLLKQTATEAEARSLTRLLGGLWLSYTQSTQTIWCPDDV